MKILGILLALLVLVIIFVFVLPIARHHNANEAFVSRDQYIAESKGRYNVFADNIDVTRPNYALAESPAEIAAATKTLQEIMYAPGLESDPRAGTYQGIAGDRQTATVPPVNNVLKDARKCEALTGRGACEKLADPGYSKCGICLKGGTKYDGSNPGGHIGGLLIIPEDKAYQVSSAKSSGTPVKYAPTAGACPAGYFFADRDTCTKEANRYDCAESGQSGGFTGKTAEGKLVAPTKCVQAPFSGDNVFVYDPKNRKFNINLRVLAPVGTGQTRVYVYDASKKQVGYGVSNTPGREFIVNVLKVKELDSLTVVVALEAPFRRNGNKEVFQYVVNEGGKTSPTYNQTPTSAMDVCARIGARGATRDELNASFNAGAQTPFYGWTSDGFLGQLLQSTNSENPNDAVCKGLGSPSANNSIRVYNSSDCEKLNGNHIPNGECLVKGGGSYSARCAYLNSLPITGVNEVNRSAPQTPGYSWCYGVKPPQSTKTDLFNTTVLPFFVAVKATEANQKSQYGDSYQAPYFRGVLLQWEMTDGNEARTAVFESSITGVNGLTSDPTTGANKILRRLGTYKSSSIINSPKPMAGGFMLTNQFWLWSNIASNQSVRFDVKVPGTFLDPFYPEDKLVAPSGPLVSSPETAKYLRTNPCMADGQVAGAYSNTCLASLFASSGGDLINGKLPKENGGLPQLNAYGDMDAISAYLDNLYALATTGKDNEGNTSDRDTINNAAQLLFGFDLMTPCEDISEDAAGNVMLQQKTGGLSPDCLDYLWMNTGSDLSRGQEAANRKTTVGNTYTSIGERYSGLRANEGSKTRRKQYPFQTCQRTGTLAPVDANGKQVLGNVNAINSAALVARGTVCAANSRDPRCSNGSVVGFVQDLYNSVFQSANSGADAARSDAQAEAVAKCFGINKIKSPPPAPAFRPVLGKAVGRVNIPTGNYSLSFDITPRGTTGNWGNIIHVSNGGNCCDFGGRAPGIWFLPGDTSLHIRLGDAADGNWGVDRTNPLPLNQTSSVSIVAEGRNVSIQCGSQSISLTQPTRRPTGNGFIIYMADPWYDAANAEITNFKYVVDGVDVTINP